MNIPETVHNNRTFSNRMTVLAVVSVVFLNSLFNGFVYDDWVLMVYNDVYRSFDLNRIFFSMANSMEYLPVRDLTLAVDAFIWGMRPFGFHLTNLLFYLLSLLAFSGMVRRLLHCFDVKDEDERIVLFATLVFGVHPLHTEVVNFIAARNNLMAGLFLFLSFNVLFDGLKDWNRWQIILSVFLFVLGMFSKVTIVFYPLFLAFVLILSPSLDVLFRRKLWVLAVFLLVSGACLLVHLRLAQASSVVNENLIRFGSSSIAMTIGKVLMIPFYYLKKLILPYNLSISYPVTFETVSPLTFVIFLPLYLIGAYFLYLAWKRGYRIVVAGVVWFVVSLGPILNIFPTSPVVADRYAFFASAGFALLAGRAVHILVQKRREIAYLFWALILIMGVLSFTRNLDWRNDVLLWESAVKTDPGLDASNLASALWNRGDHDRALSYFKREQERRGGYLYDLYKGRFYYLSGEHKKALQFYDKAFSEGAGALKEANLYRAEAFEKAGNIEQALKYYLRVFDVKSIDPLYEYSSKAKEGLSRIREPMERKLQELSKKAEESPTDFEKRVELAAFLAKLGKFDESEKHYRLAIKMSRKRWEPLYDLGIVLMKQDQYDEAIDIYRRALLLSPENPDVLRNIGICFLNTGRTEEAAESFKMVLKSSPENIFAAFNLGKIFFNAGDREQAVKYLLHARILTGRNISLRLTIDGLLNKLDINIENNAE